MWLPVDRTENLEMEVTGLVPGEEYLFRVKAVNKEGESEPLDTPTSIVAKDPFSKMTTDLVELLTAPDQRSLQQRYRALLVTQSPLTGVKLISN